MNPISKGLIIAGAVLILGGLFYHFFGKAIPLGRLPGDIYIKGKNGSFYFPVATCLLLSAVLTGLAWLWQWWKK